jgi:hypothetical protein
LPTPGVIFSGGCTKKIRFKKIVKVKISKETFPSSDI